MVEEVADIFIEQTSKPTQFFRQSEDSFSK